MQFSGQIPALLLPQQCAWEQGTLPAPYTPRLSQSNLSDAHNSAVTEIRTPTRTVHPCCASARGSLKHPLLSCVVTQLRPLPRLTLAQGTKARVSKSDCTPARDPALPDSWLTASTVRADDGGRGPERFSASRIRLPPPSRALFVFQMPKR